MPDASRKPVASKGGGSSAAIASSSSSSLPKQSLLQSYDSKISFVRPGFRSEAAVLYCIVESIVEEEALLHSNKNARHKNNNGSSSNNNSSSNISRSNSKHAANALDSAAGESKESSLQRNASANESLSSGQSVASSADLSTNGSSGYLVSPIEDIPIQFVTSDGTVSTLAPDQGDFIFANLLYSEQNDKYKLPIVNTDILVVEDSDLFQMKALAVMFGSGTLALSVFELAVLSFQRNALVRSFINKTLGKDALPIEPAKSDTVRSVEESEILTFSSLSAKDFHRYRQIQELDSIVKANSKPLPNFTGLTKKNDGEDGSLLKRRYFRPLMSQTLSQILINESMREPIVLKKYYAPSDELLYVLFWPTPDRRQSTKVFAPFDYILAKNKFAKLLPKKGKKPSKEDLTAAASLSNIAMSLKEWDCLQQDCVTLTPAGQGLVTVQQFRSNQIAWVTTHVAGYILGLRGKLISGVDNPNKRTSNTSSRASSAKPSRSAPPAATVTTDGTPLGSTRPNDETSPVVESAEDVDIVDNDDAAEEEGLENTTTTAAEGNENQEVEGGGGGGGGNLAPVTIAAPVAATAAAADTSDAKNHVPASRRVSDVPVMAADGTFIMHCSDDTRISIVSVPKRQYVPPVPLPLISIDEDNTMTNSALQNMDDLTSGLENLEASLAAGQEEEEGGGGGSNPPSQPGSARSTSSATNNNNNAPPAVTSASGSTATATAMPEISTTADSSLLQISQSQPGSKVPSARPSPRFQSSLEDQKGATEKGKEKEKEKKYKGKPDGFGTVMMSFTFPNDLQVMAHSDSTISMSTFRKYDPKAISGESSIGFEERRVYLAKGVIVRYIHQSSPFSMDIMTRDGNRVLRRNGSYFATLLRREQSSTASSGKMSIAGSHNTQSTLNASSSEDLLQMTGFYKALIDEAPRVWTSIIIYKDGRLEYHYDPYEMTASDKFSRDDYRATNMNPREASLVCAHSILPKDNRKIYIDAETKAVISTYRDGRRVIAHANGSLEVDFPDTTRYVVHKSGSMVYITHSSLPTVEIDLEVDAVSRDHSNGKQVPISKGGDRVRSRIGLPDGSALLIKYDTRITAHCNGSMKLVRLDRSTLMAKDNCDIIFRPGSSWDKRDEDFFAEECADIDFDPKDTSNHNKKDVKFSKSTKEETLRMASALESNSLNTGNDDDATLLTADTSGKKGGYGGGGGGGSSVGKFDNNSLESNSKSRASTDARSRGGEGGNNKMKHEKRTIKQKGVSELAQCNSLATIESYGVGSNNSASRIIHTNKDVFLNLEAKDTKYTYNPLKMVCVVEDYEHNRFEVNLLLNDPLKVAVALAGEVVGLKPQAVSEAPIDPRAFTIKRNGQVCELCSIDNVSALESLVSQHQDGIKSLQYAISQPSDLGSAQQHLFYMRIRNGVFDKLEFDDIFTPRLWSKVKRPATVEYVCKVNNGNGGNNNNNNSNNSGDGQLLKGIVSKELCPRLYTFNMMLERLPLSTEGFLKLSEDVAKWEQFRTDRELSIHRFAIEDTRSAEELEEEQRVKAKLKQVYKIAKKMEKAKKEKEKEERARLQSISQSDPLKEPQVTIGKDGKAKVPLIAHTSLEKVVEEKSDEDAAFSFDGEEEEDEEAIARSREIKDAFLTYSTPSDGAEFDESDIDNHTISKGDLPNAYLQLMHAVIKKDLLEDILVDLDLQNCDSFYFLEFKGIFVRLEVALVEMEEKRKAAGRGGGGGGGGGGGSVSDLGSDSDGYDSDTLMKMDLNPSISEAIPSGGDPSSTYRPPSPPRKSTDKHQQTTTTNATTNAAAAAAPPLDNFWKNTANGKSYTSSNPPSAEPLIHRPWNWDPNQSNEYQNASSADMPRGNAVNAVRTAKK